MSCNANCMSRCLRFSSRYISHQAKNAPIDTTTTMKVASAFTCGFKPRRAEEKITIDYEDRMANEEFDEEILHMRQLLKTKLVDLDLSVRALNCLKAAEVEALGDLVKFNKNDLLKFRNFGKKSLTELEDLLATMGLSFGMDVTKYKLDKD